MFVVACIKHEIVFVAEVDAMYPGRVNAVGFCILALLVLQITVAMHVIHETGLVVGRYETELSICNLFIGWHIDGIVVVTVTVDIVRRHVGVVGTTAPSFVNKAVVIAALVFGSQCSNKTIGCGVLGVVQLDVVGAFNSGHIGKCRFSIRAGHTCHILCHGVGVGSHQADPLCRLRIVGDVCRPTVTAAGVLQHKCLGAGTITIGINRTVVHAVESGKTTYRRNAPVRNGNTVDCLVVDSFHCDRGWERSWEGIVNRKRCFPYLGHFEILVNTCNCRRNSTIFRRDGGWVTQ